MDTTGLFSIAKVLQEHKMITCLQKFYATREYAAAWEDGIITEEELKELRSFQEILGITDEDAAKMNLEAAVKSASKDGKITKDEEAAIKKAAAEAKEDGDSMVLDAKEKAKKEK